MIKYLLIFHSLIFLVIKTSYAESKIINSTIIENNVNQISKNIRCLVCRNQTIESSNSEFAIDIKKMMDAQKNSIIL